MDVGRTAGRSRSVPLARSTGRIADHPRPAADEGDRLATGPLETHEAEDRARGDRRAASGVGSNPMYARMGRSVARRASRPSVTSWTIPRQRRSASSVERRAAVTASHRRARTRRSNPGAPNGDPCPLCYRADAMQTSLARRQRRRRNGSGHRPSSGRRTVADIAIAIPIFLFTSLARRRAPPGSRAPSAAFSLLQPGPPRSHGGLGNIQFDQETRIYDRTGKVDLARSPRAKREVVDLRPDPGRVVDATTAIEDKNFWVERRLRPGRHHLRGPGHALRAPAGRPRSPSSSCATASCPSRVHDHLRAEDPGDHPVDPPDRGVSRRGGQEEDHRRLPELELLRKQELRDQGRCEGLLRQAHEADAGPVGHPRRAPAVTHRVRSRCGTRVEEELPDGKTQLVVPADTADRPQRRNYILELMKTRRCTPPATHGRGLRRGRCRSRSC